MEYFVLRQTLGTDGISCKQTSKISYSKTQRKKNKTRNIFKMIKQPSVWKCWRCLPFWGKSFIKGWIYGGNFVFIIQSNKKTNFNPPKNWIKKLLQNRNFFFRMSDKSLRRQRSSLLLSCCRRKEQEGGGGWSMLQGSTVCKIWK